MLLITQAGTYFLLCLYSGRRILHRQRISQKNPRSSPSPSQWLENLKLVQRALPNILCHSKENENVASERARRGGLAGPGWPTFLCIAETPNLERSIRGTCHIRDN
ncbi:hypothetical protein TWF217_005875 [Orbilia oligospora]|nr:hypothetical protein TWF751_004838 [Orbilia oligospora]KAF3257766.1 hypothetical protein TWF217_005875 [Orbilia oligospora]KAF3283987.1 hypothetical protein TWF132_009880 [Orbilia oligospora]